MTPPPFRVKGIVYRGTKAFFDSLGPGQYERLLVAIEDPGLRAFFTQQFLPSSWYDVLPVARLIEIEAKVLGLSLPEYLRRRATFQADRDIGGVYRFVLKVVSPHVLAPRLGSLLSQVFDFGESQARELARGHFEYRFVDWPLVLVPWYTNAFVVYARRALVLAGAVAPVVRILAVTSGRVAHGVPLATIDTDIRF